MTNSWNIYSNRLVLTAGTDGLRPGDHLITPRRRYVHHGIYAGAGRVVHYAGLCHSLRPLPVEEVPLEAFTRGHQLARLPRRRMRFSGPAVVARARSRMGEDAYDLLNNNCEHFCTWCLDGEARSEQVARFFELSPALLQRVLHRIRHQAMDHPACAA